MHPIPRNLAVVPAEKRAYEAARIRSRAQLVELADRGRRAAARVEALLDPLRPLPLIADGLELRFELAGENVIQPRHLDHATVFVRLAPYTLTPRYREWATTGEAASAVLATAENLADIHGLSPRWAVPDPAGVGFRMGPIDDPRRRHCDGTGHPVDDHDPRGC
jgi:hypothetical protein